MPTIQPAFTSTRCAPGHSLGIDRMQTRAKHVAWHFWGLVSLWSGAILIMFLADSWHLDRTIEEIAVIEARAYLKKDRALRLWAASHGGVYVPVSATTPPNPFLRDVPERDIRTPQGRLLTLMNPAYMIRQIMTEFEQAYQVRGHITSLLYFREETAPDAWERTALAAFEKGRQEICAFTDIRGKPYLRIMRPLTANPSCLKCHAAQGYKVGDIRGGVSLSLPMGPYMDHRRKEIAAHGVSFAVLWILGAAGFWLAASKLSHLMKKHDAVEEELKTSEAQLKHVMADLVRNQESERKAIAQEIHEEIAQSLSAIKMSLETWVDTDAHSEDFRSQVMLAIIERTKTDIDLIRRLTKRLSPIMLDDLGIKTTIAALCEEIAATLGGCEIRMQIDVDEAIIPGELKIAIYRVLEDLLTLSPDRCPDDRWSVSLNACDANLRLVVNKRGRHAAYRADNSTRDAEVAMAKNRAESFGGAMKIDREQENGFTVTVLWPLLEAPQR